MVAVSSAIALRGLSIEYLVDGPNPKFSEPSPALAELNPSLTELGPALTELNPF